MLFIEPHAHETPLIQAARLHTRPGGSLALNVYELTNRRLEGLLVSRAEAGVRVRILLDGAPRHGGRILGRERAFCRRNPELTCRIAPSRFRFDHAKYVIFDGRYACIGTANWTWSAFHRNREYIDCTGHRGTVEALQHLFRSDWRDVPAGRRPRQALVLSPGAQRPLERLLRGSGALDIETEEMGGVKTLDRLIARHGSHARVLLPARLSARDRYVARKLARQGVAVRLLSHPYLHAKLILTGSRAFIGSENLTWTSLMRNREVGLLIQNPGILARLHRQFASDWARGRPLSRSR